MISLDAQEPAKADVLVKRKVVDEDAKKVFDRAPLEGVGTETWKLLWEQARAYSENIAYPEKIFPNTDDEAVCILCQQPLSDEAKGRFNSFEEYVKGELLKQAAEAEQHLFELSSSLGEVPKEEHINLILDSIGISNENERSKVIDFCASLEKRKASLVVAKDQSQISPLPGEDILVFFSEWTSSVAQQAAAYEEDVKKENRDDLVKSVIGFEAQKWLFQQKNSIDEEVKRLVLLQKFKEAQSLANTQTLSTKKSSLSEELITNEYIKRFQNELEALGGTRIKVEIIKTRAQKGHIYHQIKLKNSNSTIRTADVLSEGEFRVVSLAGFLADVEGRINNTPFIFDDPISSLDQDFEEATVTRLVNLSKTRQVIVLTHRLSLLALLEDAAKNEIDYDVICLRAEHWGVGEPGETPMFAKKPDKALNFLINERLARARKTLEELGRDEYELIAKGICSDFRILLERFIENDLIANVVQRFRRYVNTMGKIHRLANIQQEDCQLFDDFMTKYSKYEHSQSREAPVTLPDPDELQKDMEIIKNWFEEFSKRTAS